MISNVVWSAVAAVLFMLSSVLCAVLDEFSMSVVLALALAGVTCAILSIRE